MVLETSRQLEPNRLFAQLYTQLEPLTRMPRRLGHLVGELERGSLKVGIVLTGLDDFEHNMRSIANRVGASIVISSLLIASSLVSMSHRAEWLAVAGFSLAALLGAYMIWRIARRPGEL